MIQSQNIFATFFRRNEKRVFIETFFNLKKFLSFDSESKDGVESRLRNHEHFDSIRIGFDTNEILQTGNDMDTCYPVNRKNEIFRSWSVR